MRDIRNYSTFSKHYDNSKKLVIEKVKDEPAVLRLRTLLN